MQVKLGNSVWHKGHANLSAVLNATVSGSISVAENDTICSVLYALNGFEFEFNGVPLLTAAKEALSANAFLSFGPGYGVKIGGVPVLIHVSEGDI